MYLILRKLYNWMYKHMLINQTLDEFFSVTQKHLLRW